MKATKNTVIMLATLLLSITGFAQVKTNLSARDVVGAPSIIPLKLEPEAKLIVDAPLAAELAAGKVIIQYRTENLKIVPVYGEAGLKVSPRIGHLHITVDNLPWHWADASNQPIIIVGMAPGRHTILFELADTTHHVLEKQLITFEIPEAAANHPHH
ncbi:hypothetical protein Q765_17410 [Flavobacterium rivuli WB 3.3-2 = DSM 21788]|uniref:Uncharacterized protein n=1 Tax=Flavobacterium rivuli WB 3.3-2 = DSM 21788 TaxID=1121895 RepID=A0A0A2MAG4_9FLAO|nr:DUF6130 family protein [Flavobacterium rivuli]KGO85270.1 hypothetical protein Q765_17410 [Flavobacterium rivuli WB 3.3-2 = DSM 21788]